MGTLLVPGRFNGPASSGNGGWTSGALAAAARSLTGWTGDVTVQLRAHGAEHRAVVTVHAEGGRVEIDLLHPAEGIAPGQAAVIYDGSRVVGSATISATARSEALA